MDKTITELQKEIHLNAHKKGFYDSPRPVPEILCLIHSEVSEALEAYRKIDVENFAEEMADIAIRVMDTCEHLNINLYKEIIKKHNINLTRPYKHDKIC